jgi:hypothetical protein
MKNQPEAKMRRTSKAPGAVFFEGSGFGPGIPKTVKHAVVVTLGYGTVLPDT